MTTSATARTAPRPRVDPRLRARRISVRRAEGRRRLHRLALLALVIGLAAAAWGVTRSPVLDIDRIQVRGAGRTAVATVLATSGIERGSALTELDPGAVEARLERLPWVARAEVERRWPGSVEVTVHERVPVALVTDQAGGRFLVDGAGRVLAGVVSASADLPRVDGVAPVGAPGTDVEATTLDAVRLARLLPGRLRPEVDAVRVDGDDLVLELVGGGRVLVGDGRDLGTKLLATGAVLARVGELSGTLDVRVPASPVLTGGPQ
ncbi:MAG: FtsQ-type POTRA domain-containing protein [Acidimicrobiales bacterium]|nr:FtsQ-type POTRA domain-containing protein [Acidimicrobiales bacterium]